MGAATDRLRQQLEEAVSPSGDPTEYRCVVCKDVGWLVAEQDGLSCSKRCECRKQAIAKAKLSAIADEFPEFAGAQLHPFTAKNPGQRDAHAIITSDPLKSYFLHSTYGRGKTFLLVAQFRYLIDKGIPCAIRTSKQLVDELKKAELSQGLDAEPYISPVMDAAANYEKFHLFWDDCEKAAARTDFRQEAIFDLVDTLYRRKLDLTITSNLPIFDPNANDAKPTDLRFKLGNATVRRINDMCRKIQL